MCRGCRHQSTVTAGTVFDKTRTPLRTWFAAIWYVTNQKHLDEFTFRFNRRTSRSRGLLFYRLLSQAAVSAPVTYRAITQTKGAASKALGVEELNG